MTNAYRADELLGHRMPAAVWDDALIWLPSIPAASARAVIFDPPYAVGTPVRGREDGAAGSVFGPLSFLSRTLREVTRILVPGGIALLFADWRRMPDLNYIASTVGLRPATQVAWVRSRPGTGGLLRASWDPVQIVSRGVPDAIDRAAIPNVVRADYPSRRQHPYGKPAQVYQHILARVCRPGDLIVDPFAGSGVTAEVAAALHCRWMGCDIDPAWGGDPADDAAALTARGQDRLDDPACPPPPRRAMALVSHDWPALSASERPA